MSERFFITGATGATAAIVASQLHNKGASVCAPVRDEAIRASDEPWCGMMKLDYRAFEGANR